MGLRAGAWFGIIMLCIMVVGGIDIYRTIRYERKLLETTVRRDLGVLIRHNRTIAAAEDPTHT